MELLADTHAWAFAIALLAAAAMGFSIQQGGTCMVGAVSQLVLDRRGGRAIALLECSLWVLALGLAASVAGLRFQASLNFPIGGTVIAGGVLLGIGAWINDACVFGSIARIGNRDLNYLLTPPGFFLGSLVHASFVAPAAAGRPMTIQPGVAVLLLLLFAGSLLVSLKQFLGFRRNGKPLHLAWDYRHATIAIGITFVVLSVLAGPWTYTDALARAAHGRGVPQLGQALLFAALLGGAMLGGRASSSIPFRAGRAAACLTGGALMGFGAALVPGGNDNLILVGLPWLQPHAWLAIGAMALAIAAGLLGRRLGRKLKASGVLGWASST